MDALQKSLADITRLENGYRETREEEITARFEEMDRRHAEEKEPLERHRRQEPTPAHERRDAGREPANDHDAGQDRQVSPVFERAKAAREAKEARRQEGRERSGGRRYEPPTR